LYRTLDTSHRRIEVQDRLRASTWCVHRWVRFRTSAPLPKFVTHRRNLQHELRKQRGTSNFMILVRLLNLRFLNERAARNDRNLKFAALVDRTQHTCHCTIPGSGLAWRTKYSCCFATSSTRKQSSMARVDGPVSNSSSFLMWSIFALMTCCCIANAPSSTDRTERKERRQRLFSHYADTARQRCAKGGR
jgi:hypothetical protein